MQWYAKNVAVVDGSYVRWPCNSLMVNPLNNNVGLVYTLHPAIHVTLTHNAQVQFQWTRSAGQLPMLWMRTWFAGRRRHFRGMSMCGHLELRTIVTCYNLLRYVLHFKIQPQLSQVSGLLLTSPLWYQVHLYFCSQALAFMRSCCILIVERPKH